jgi:hypothetical protein
MFVTCQNSLSSNLLLVLTSTVILASESRGTHGLFHTFTTLGDVQVPTKTVYRYNYNLNNSRELGDPVLSLLPIAQEIVTQTFLQWYDI